MTASALIIDDEPDIRELIALTISRMGLDCHSAANLQEAANLLEHYEFDVCLTDMKLPDGNGVEFLRQIKTKHPDLPVAVITAHGNMDAAVDAMKNGAYDFVSKPVDIHQLRTLVTTAVAQSHKAANDENAVATKPDQSRPVRVATEVTTSFNTGNPEKAQPRNPNLAGTEQIIGNSQAITSLKTMVLKLSRTNAPVWINGESGTGKELTARMIHTNSARSESPFIAINCGAIPAELMESELFGHKKGSFTGAVNDHKGLFAHAEGGTLFLDEVAELPLSMQVKLLRAIQEKSIRPVGEASEVKVDVRLLSASHKDLNVEVEAGRFRHDLYYRLNVISLTCPSLRDRPDDIPALASHILAKHSDGDPGTSYSFTEQALYSLTQYNFPGNVRELENIIERTIAMSDDRVIDVADLQLENRTAVPNATVDTNSIAYQQEDSTAVPSKLPKQLSANHEEKTRIINALENNRWNRKAASRELGLTYRQLRYRIKQLGLDQSD